ncbi:MAG: alpha/beta fold hydrolase [Candidatus Hermodarchaeota archaeon]
MANIIFVHGLESSGKGFKGNLFRKVLPGILTPDFTPFSTEISYKVLLKKRMLELFSILDSKQNWIIIGSSFGGLMGALYTCKYQSKVSRLILLAPLLATSLLNPKNFVSVDVPVIVFHGRYDQIVPYKPTEKRARELFNNLEYNIVNDDHMLHLTVQTINWLKITGIS